MAHLNAKINNSLYKLFCGVPIRCSTVLIEGKYYYNLIEHKYSGLWYLSMYKHDQILKSTFYKFQNIG